MVQSTRRLLNERKASEWLTPSIEPPEILSVLEIEQFSSLGSTPCLIVEAEQAIARPYRGAQAVVIGVDRKGDLPETAPDDFDILISTADKAQAPWICVPPQRLDAQLATLTNAVHRAPHAAAILRQVLRLNEKLPIEDALLVESFAYSTLLGGAEFAKWRSETRDPFECVPGRINFERHDDLVSITLAQPDTRNAMSAPMRDALHEALAATLDDPSAPNVTLRAEGACFSVGGALSEFGENRNLSEAHSIRTLRSVARLMFALGDRCSVELQGACIGAGIEIAAAAGRRIARGNAFFQLPELKMGLVPGAGGTVSVPRAIGRHRACAMMLSCARIRAETALAWGLVDSISSP